MLLAANEDNNFSTMGAANFAKYTEGYRNDFQALRAGIENSLSVGERLERLDGLYETM